MRWVSRRKSSVVWGMTVIGLLAHAATARGAFVFSEPTKVPNVNSDSSDHSPFISRDGLELYFISSREPVPGEFPDNIWVSRRSTVKAPWSVPVKLNASVDLSGPELAPSLSADGLELYFADGELHTPNPGGYGGSDLWVVRRASRDAAWGAPVNLGPTINTEYNENTPCISADGLELYFAYNETFAHVPNHPYCSELLVATRPTKDDPWGEPVNLGSNVNSYQYEYTPFISSDGLSLFFSSGFSKSHIYVCRRATTADPWGPAEFFTPVNSGSDTWQSAPGESEYSLCFSTEDSTLYFARGTDVLATDFNIWQVEVTPVVNLNRDAVVDTADVAILTEHWGQNEPSCDISPIPLGDGVVDEKDLAALYKYVDGDLAVVPTPALCQTDVVPFVELRWTRGAFAQTYDVYFGTSVDDIRNASRTDPRGVLVSQNQDANTYDPEGVLEFLQTYHWRVDEVNALSNPAIVKGVVWSFTTGARGGAIRQITATASSAATDAGPEHTVDGSGLDAYDLHSTDFTTMWLSAVDGPQPTWIQYEFDAVHPLDEMWIWNYNELFDKVLGFGLKDVTVEYSQDGVSWATLGDFEFARGTSQNDYGYNTIVEFGGVMARYVRLTALSNWGGMSPQYGLSEVRFFYMSPEADEL